MSKRQIALVFFLSGMAALFYEILWARHLGLLFGTSLRGITAATIIFFGGLAAGSVIGGKLAAKFNLPIKLWSLVEGGIGIFGLIFAFFGFRLFDIEAAAVSGGAAPVFGLAAPITFIAALFLFLSPAILIGTTFPIVVSASKKLEVQATTLLSSLYKINTLGAVTGVVSGGFFLIWILGMPGLAIAAAAINFALAFILWSKRNSFVKTASPIGEAGAAPPKSAGARDASPKAVRLYAYALIFITGFIALVLEILWTRVFAMSFGSSVYAFSAVLAMFLLGIVVGSAFLERLSHAKDFSLIRVLTKTLLLSGLCVWLGILIIVYLPNIYLTLMPERASFGANIVLLITFAVLIIFPFTFLAGISFPILLKLASGGLEEGAIGRAYGLNTLGSIFGSGLGIVLFIKILGSQTSFLLCAWLLIVAGALGLLFLKSKTSNLYALGSILFMVLLTLVTPKINPALQNSGFFLQFEDLRGRVGEWIKENRLLFWEEGELASIAVFENEGGIRYLSSNGKVDASTCVDLETEILLGQIPLILKSETRDVLVIGLGSGITLGSVLTHPVEKVHMLEIEPAIVAAAKYFSQANGNALDDERVSVYVEDARHFLSGTRNKYDVIVAEPSNPWIAGESNLFTKEYFKLAKSRLKDGGIMMQWLHYYRLSPQEVTSIIKTFNAVFPYVTVFGSLAPPGDLYIVGSSKDIVLSREELASRLARPAVRENLSSIRTHSQENFLAHFLFDQSKFDGYLGSDSMIFSDTRPVLEFRAPLTLYRSVVHNQNLYSLDSFLESPSELVAGLSPTVLSSAIDWRTKLIKFYILYIEGKEEEANKKLDEILAIDPLIFECPETE